MPKVLQGIRVVKLLGWELPFMNKILSKREQEMSYSRYEARIGALLSFFLISLPTIATMVSFVTFSATGRV
jgi:hypothetical protein